MCGTSSSVEVYQDGAFSVIAPTWLFCLSIITSLAYLGTGWSAFNLSIFGYAGAILGLVANFMLCGLLTEDAVPPSKFKQLTDVRGVLIAAPIFSLLGAILHIYLIVTVNAVLSAASAVSLSLSLGGLDFELYYYLNIGAAAAAGVSGIINIVLAVDVSGIISEASSQGLPMPGCCACCGGGTPNQMVAQPVQPQGTAQAHKVSI